MIEIEYKLFFVIIAVLALTINFFSQTVRFTYDASGNRTERFIRGEGGEAGYRTHR